MKEMMQNIINLSNGIIPRGDDAQKELVTYFVANESKLVEDLKNVNEPWEFRHAKLLDKMHALAYGTCTKTTMNVTFNKYYSNGKPDIDQPQFLGTGSVVNDVPMFNAIKFILEYSNPGLYGNKEGLVAETRSRLNLENMSISQLKDLNTAFKGEEIEVVRKLCTESFSFFISYFWSTYENTPFRGNWHFDCLCDEVLLPKIKKTFRHLEEFDIAAEIEDEDEKKAAFLALNAQIDANPDKDIIINICPGTSKSTIFSVNFTPFIWIINKFKTKTVNLSSSMAIQKEFKEKASKIVNSIKWKKLFPEFPGLVIDRADELGVSTKEGTLKLRNGTESFGVLAGGGKRRSFGVSSDFTGIHGLFKIIDDLESSKTFASETEGESAYNAMTRGFSTRSQEKNIGFVLFCQQRLGPNDATDKLFEKIFNKVYLGEKDPNKRDCDYFCLPARATNLVYPPELKNRYINGLLDEVRLNDAAIETLKKNIDHPVSAKAQIDQEIVAEDLNDYIKKDHFEHIISTDEFLEVLEANNLKREPHYFFDTSFGFIENKDKVETEKEKKDREKRTDYNAGIAVEQHLGKLYIFCGMQSKSPFHDVLDEIEEFCLDNYYIENEFTKQKSSVMVEPKATGVVVIQDFQKKRRESDLKKSVTLNVRYGDEPIGRKKFRLFKSCSFLETLSVVFVFENVNRKPKWYRDLVKNIMLFGKLEHDDYTDVFTAAIKWAKRRIRIDKLGNKKITPSSDSKIKDNVSSTANVYGVDLNEKL